MVTALPVLLVSWLAAAPADAWGGTAAVTGRATGWFHLEQLGGRWWFITPDGHGFLSSGVGGVRAGGDQAPKLGYAPYQRTVAASYPSLAAWADQTVARLRGWGFNTIAGWSDDEQFRGRMAHTPVLGLAGADWLTGSFPDVFAPAWAAAVQERAAERCRPWAEEPWLLGWFLDNELSWTPDWRDTRPLLDRFLALPDDAPGRVAAAELLRRRNVAATDLSEADRDAFLAEVSERYFAVTTAAIRAVDPHHLILGCRFVGQLTPKAVLPAAGRHCDAISVQPYELTALGRGLVAMVTGTVPVEADLRTFWELSGKPVLVSEFGFRAADAGLPNTKPPLMIVLATQEERAARYRATVGAWLAQPWVVGYHWFKWCDEPAEGRFDGEDSNWGLVNVADQPYAALTEAMRELNERLAEVHLGSG